MSDFWHFWLPGFQSTFMVFLTTWFPDYGKCTEFLATSPAFETSWIVCTAFLATLILFTCIVFLTTWISDFLYSRLPVFLLDFRLLWLSGFQTTCISSSLHSRLTEFLDILTPDTYLCFKHNRPLIFLATYI